MPIFGGLVALVEILNGLGVAFVANASSSPSVQKLGSDLTIASLALQFAVIAACFPIATLFHRRCIRNGIHARAVHVPLYTLYGSITLILVRSSYRMAQRSGDTALEIDDLAALKRLNPILRYEWYFYVFEAAIMLLNSALWNVWNPGRFLPRNANVYLAGDGVSEVEAPEELDKRYWTTKLGSIFTFGLFFRRSGRHGVDTHEMSHARIPSSED